MKKGNLYKLEISEHPLRSTEEWIIVHLNRESALEIDNDTAIVFSLTDAPSASVLLLEDYMDKTWVKVIISSGTCTLTGYVNCWHLRTLCPKLMEEFKAQF